MTRPALAIADTLDLRLPEGPGGGKVSAVRRAALDAQITAWCQQLLDLKARIEFDPGPRGWCYIMEEYGLSKGDFDKAESMITKCRKSGMLPVDFTGDDDDAREAIGLERLDDPDPATEARSIMDYVKRAPDSYDPVSFWETQPCYVEMIVEKIGLRNLFEPVCEEYRVAIANTKGSWSIWQRVHLLERLAKWQAKGKRCVLLNCGDHDAHGLRISRALRANLEDVLKPFHRYTRRRYADFDLDAVEIERFGLNSDFIARHRLSWTQGLITGSGKDLGDPSHPKHFEHDVQAYIKKFGKRKVEADALVTRADAGQQLCRDAILQHIDPDGITKYERELVRKRKAMRRALDQLIRGGRTD